MSKSTGWIPLDENLKNYLPTDRPYTKLEAMFSHQLDIKKDNTFSVNGYAKLWQWSRNKVRFFIDNIKKDKGHPKGHLRDRLGTGRGQGVHLIILDLQKQKDTLGTPKEPLRSHPKSRTIKIDKRKTKKEIKEYTVNFEKFWKIYPKKIDKGAAFKTWGKLGIERNGLLEKVLESIVVQAPLMENGDYQYIKYPASWLNSAGWDNSIEDMKPREPELDKNY